MYKVCASVFLTKWEKKKSASMEQIFATKAALTQWN